MHHLQCALLVNGVAKNGKDSGKQSSKYPDNGFKLWRNKNSSDNDKGCHHTTRFNDCCQHSIFRERFLKEE
ncbi:hypothetical protein Nepgr_023849 [Nepenthes gracilis]|uniref:Uncharacterized protein n=1 Tax=Nepenthes gracilis TaxID=150966 RepID=A0AAD3XZV5_NEPGR|nr:hypothetical protein Nepgr_023849 [Nepenthes gracilis]